MSNDNYTAYILCSNYYVSLYIYVVCVWFPGWFEFTIGLGKSNPGSSQTKIFRFTLNIIVYK